MARGRPKKNLQENLNVEVRESKEAQMLEELQMEANEIVKKEKELLKFKNDSRTLESFINETVADRELNTSEVNAVINLVKVLNRHICDAQTTIKICTEMMKHYYESTEFRIYIKKVQVQRKDILIDKFIFPVDLRVAPGNAEYGIKLTQMIYSYKTNEITEKTLCEF